MEAQARGNFTDSGFKLAEWSKSEEKFNSISGEMKANRQQLQNQLAESKGFHTMYGYIVNQLSGFGIDPDTGLPTASEKCWEDFIKTHPKAGRFKTKPLPLFNDLQTFFAGKVATGQFAISLTGATKRKIEDDISVDDSSDRQPLLKKSPTDKVFDLLSSIVVGKSESKLSEALRILHSKKDSVRQCVQFKKYLFNSPGNAEAFLSASDEEVAFFIDDTLGIE